VVRGREFLTACRARPSLARWWYGHYAANKSGRALVLLFSLATSTETCRHCYLLSLLRLGFTMHGRALSFPVPTPGHWPGGEREEAASHCSCLVLLHYECPHVAMCVWTDNVHHASLSLPPRLVIRELHLSHERTDEVREARPARRTGRATVKELIKGKGTRGRESKRGGGGDLAGRGRARGPEPRGARAGGPRGRRHSTLP
jgi:hypothetical protein